MTALNLMRFQTVRSRLMNTRSNLIPLALTAAILVIFIVAVINLGNALQAQVETGQIALNYQLAEQGQAFVQLQREALRLLAQVNLPPETLYRDAAQLQIDLLASRFFQLATVSTQPVTRPEQVEAALALTPLGEGLITSAQQWLASPEDKELRKTLTDQLVDLERQVNQDVIEFGRYRVQSVITFRDATTHVQTAFAIAGFTFVLLMLALLYDITFYLRQAEEAEAARQSNRFKDQFLAVMSHELRTPLNAIIGFLGIMKMQGPDSAKLPHMIDRSRANAERLLSLIDDILDISKIEAGKFEIHPEPVVIREVVNRWRTQTEILAVQKGLEFACVVDEAMPQRILADVDTISKVATNLLSNALKFTEKGSVKLEIQALGDIWQIRVTDTGIGIPEDKQGIIFQSFRQVDGSIRRNFGGSGLGLSIVKQLTELMGGQVEVESQEGSGSSFTVTLPLVIAPAAQPSMSLEHASGAATVTA